MQKITIKHQSDHWKHRSELVEEQKIQGNRMLLNKKLAIKVIIDCRATSPHRFRRRLGFKLCDVILIKERSVLTKMMSLFEGEYRPTQYNVLTYRVELHFHDYKLAKEID